MELVLERGAVHTDAVHHDAMLEVGALEGDHVQAHLNADVPQQIAPDLLLIEALSPSEHRLNLDIVVARLVGRDGFVAGAASLAVVPGAAVSVVTIVSVVALALPAAVAVSDGLAPRLVTPALATIALVSALLPPRLAFAAMIPRAVAISPLALPPLALALPLHLALPIAVPVAHRTRELLLALALHLLLALTLTAPPVTLAVAQVRGWARMRW